MIQIRVIDDKRKQDVNLPNEPFRLFGRMIPSYCNGQWSYTTERFPPEEVTEMCFPDCQYDFDAEREHTVFLGAYDGERCIGLAVLRDDMFKYLYLDDLKISAAYRGQGVGRLLLDGAKETARERGYRGVYTIGQDNNLAACLFYLDYGFEIGGFDNRIYRGTAQEHKANILFYIDC